MKITVLSENTACVPGCTAEHGLSLLIEWDGCTLLMDTGASDAFLRNADALGCDLSRVQAVVVSHGHYDHAGGVPAFALRYPQTPVYLHRGADSAFFSLHEDGTHFIGIDNAIPRLPQLHWTDACAEILPGAEVFSGIALPYPLFSGSGRMRVRRGCVLEQDDFAHEQYLVIRESGRMHLFSGCAHNGILNILSACQARYGVLPDTVFSGFHFMKRIPYTLDETRFIEQTAHTLSKYPTQYYTCHCTSPAAFSLMLPILPEQLHAVSTGSIVTL